MIFRRQNRPLTRHPVFRGYLRLCTPCITAANREGVWKVGVLAVVVPPERCDCKGRCA